MVRCWDSAVGTLMLGQFVGTVCDCYSGINVLFSVVLYSGFAGMHLITFWGVCQTKIYMLKLPLDTAS